ncbi:MAG TPA: hypothetical protein VFW40_11845, partial [Capsulimonadaceae bacterium]|nr:hypothetical protein [Capsulimonadaceae bacterium]
KSVLARDGIVPRASARRRDNMLALADYVHFAFKPLTPILADKLNKGYPHAVLVFEGGALAQLPGHALLPYNTKAWRTRAAYVPVTDNSEKARLLRRRDSFGELQSLEFLVKYGVGLEALMTILFMARGEMEGIERLCGSLPIKVPAALQVDGDFAVAYAPSTGEKIERYFEACLKAGVLLSPPVDIPFD